MTGCGGGSSGTRPIAQTESEGDPLLTALRDFAPRARDVNEQWDPQMPSLGLDPDGTSGASAGLLTNGSGLGMGTGALTPTPMGVPTTTEIDESLPEQTAWSIVLVSLAGERAEIEASNVLTLAKNAGFDAQLQRRGSSYVVTTGEFDAPGDAKAQALLREVQAFSTGTARPFASALLMPPSSFVSGSVPEFDLRNVKRMYGEAAIYTLQIGVYRRDDQELPTEKDLAEFRKAAEDAVLDLRKEGVPAFYSHGRNTSSVTVGVFSDEDYRLDPRTGRGIDGMRVAQLRARFPHLLLNGKTFFRGGSKGETPSNMVRVPSN